ncbi:MAG: exodeoxyribonuclease VII large subunit [Rhabdochlamydiaceae bacterium]
MSDVLSVTELTVEIKKSLECKFFNVSVRGEITNFKHQSSGHLYFTLKDNQSQLSAVLFKGHTKNLKKLPKDGDQVIAKGELSVYSPRGTYQLLIRELEFSGQGELLLKLYQLKKKLEEKGWLDPSLKKALPKMPRKIGIVTSPTGAVIQDIINILSRRFWGLHIIINPVKVQGDGAAKEISLALQQFNEHNLVDVIILARGGGSLEDLAAFNEECVAEAIFKSQIPIISAIGHETDFSISDFVADVRAPTPSAAAELVIGEKTIYLKELHQWTNRFFLAINHKMKHTRLQIEVFKKHPCFISSYFILGKHYQKTDDLELHLQKAISKCLEQKKIQIENLKKQAIVLNPKNYINMLKQKLLQLNKQITIQSFILVSTKKETAQIDKIKKMLPVLMQSRLEAKKTSLLRLLSHLKSIDPKNLLSKGYCIPFSENKNSVILSKNELSPGIVFNLLMHDGEIKAKTLE